MRDKKSMSILLQIAEKTQIDITPGDIDSPSVNMLIEANLAKIENKSLRISENGREFLALLNNVDEIGKKLTHSELIALMVQNPQNNKAWAEFYSRFHSAILHAIVWACNSLRIKQEAFTIDDLVQEVYLLLIKDNCKALRTFSGRSENSIFAYLRILAINVVRKNLSRERAKQRNVRFSDSNPLLSFEDSALLAERSLLADPIDRIEAYLNEILSKSRTKERDKLIFKLFYFEGFHIKEIANDFGMNLSEKRVVNIIGSIKAKLRHALLKS